MFGRRTGRPLTQKRKDAIDKLLAEISLKPEHLQEEQNVTPADIFGKIVKETWFEIGFGSGEHLSALMRQNPNTCYLGAEPFLNGMSSFLKDIEDLPHDNIRVIMDDAMFIANSLAPNTLDGMYILNPDPWHKKRHFKRRIVNTENLDVFARILKPGAKLILTTDVPELADWMMIHAGNHPAFEWTAQTADDWRNQPEGWTTTKYETKRAKGATMMVYYTFIRK